MHIKVDEDLPLIAAEWLREREFEASTVVEQGMGGWKDDQLWEAVQEKAQFLITADVRVSRQNQQIPPANFGGIIR